MSYFVTCRNFFSNIYQHFIKLFRHGEHKSFFWNNKCKKNYIIFHRFRLLLFLKHWMISYFEYEAGFSLQVSNSGKVFLQIKADPRL